MRVDFTIDGKPQGKGRPRLSYGRIKTPEQTVIYKLYKNKKEFKKLFSIYNRTKKKRVKNKYHNKMIKFIISHPMIG